MLKIQTAEQNFRGLQWSHKLLILHVFQSVKLENDYTLGIQKVSFSSICLWIYENAGIIKNVIKPKKKSQ